MTSRDLVFEGTTSGFFNPGGSGEVARTVESLDPGLFATRRDLASGVDSMFRPNARGLLSLNVSIQGLGASMQHAAAVAAFLPGAIGSIHATTGEFTTEMARKSMQSDFRKPPIDSGDTLRSIHARLETTPNMVKTSVGPTTFYSPLIEFGLARHFTYGPRPFMSLAFSRVLPYHLQALRELAQVASGPRKTISTDPHAGPTNQFLRKFRAFLYDFEKRLGDIIPLVDLRSLRGPREAALTTARGLGDLQAVVGHSVGSRVVRRLSGQVTGRLIGIGGNTVFASRQVNADFGFAQRRYNAFAGKHLSQFVGQMSFYRGGG